MRIRKTKKQYIEYLNSMFTKKEALEFTRYIWDDPEKWTKSQMNRAKELVSNGYIGQCLKDFDPVEFDAGYKDWIETNKTTENGK